MMSIPHAAIQLRLGERRELRPLHAHVGASLVDGRAGGFGSLVSHTAQRRAERMREADVRDEPLAEERRWPPFRAIEELVGDDQVERLVVLLEAADRTGREDELDAQQLEAEDIGAEVQLARHEYRWPAPWRARKATRLPRSVPTT